MGRRFMDTAKRLEKGELPTYQPTAFALPHVFVCESFELCRRRPRPRQTDHLNHAENDASNDTQITIV